ncbi:IS6 family transposase [Methylobacterium sp. PvR107]|uniref:IS6 family transposase n=1 Tax=Methylobacterium sp. PvR107 TaxID=2806597 RepID=UPI001AE533B8|nr:IS6 family transposase [Methylobacterium sp. PvR107]MBP1179240.1 transposase-like protein [Methylobacterium sp. PvR107]
MSLNALALKLKREARDDFKGRHSEASLVVQAVSWYLRDALSYRGIEEMLLERGLTADHSTINRWVLAFAPAIERRLRRFRKPHRGSVRVDEPCIRVRGRWHYLYRASGKHAEAAGFLLTANRDLDAVKRFFCKMLQDQPRLAPDRICTDGAGPYPSAIAESRKGGLPPHTYLLRRQAPAAGHRERPLSGSNAPRREAVACARSFHVARRTIQGFAAMLWPQKGSEFSSAWMACEHNQLLAYCFGLPVTNQK